MIYHIKKIKYPKALVNVGTLESKRYVDQVISTLLWLPRKDVVITCCLETPFR